MMAALAVGYFIGLTGFAAMKRRGAHIREMLESGDLPWEQLMIEFHGWQGCVFSPKASPMLGFSFSHFVARERYERVDGGEPWEIAWESFVGRERMEATIGWTEGKPWEIAWGEFCWEGTDGSNDWVDGEETVGNSLGRVPWEGARWKRREGGRRGSRGK